MIALNFGCGSNHIPGWRNYDTDVDISRPLPFADAYANFIFAEHVVEHIEYMQALAFFRECRRVLKPVGVVRIAVPSIEKIWLDGTKEYFQFTHGKGWAKTADARGVMQAILDCHGHKAPWTASLLAASLYLAGFDEVGGCEVGQSEHSELRGVEGHGRAIGDANNAIETVVCEGMNTKPATGQIFRSGEIRRAVIGDKAFLLDEEEGSLDLDNHIPAESLISGGWRRDGDVKERANFPEMM